MTALVLVVLVPFVVVVSMACWGLSLVVGRPLRGPDSVGSGLRRGLHRLVMGLIVAPTLALQAYARRREYAADDRAVEVLDDPLALARALKKIQRASEPGWGLFSWLLPDRNRRTTERTRLERAFASHPTDRRAREPRSRGRNRHWVELWFGPVATRRNQLNRWRVSEPLNCRSGHVEPSHEWEIAVSTTTED